jgi:Transposase zinc-binding domain
MPDSRLPKSVPWLISEVLMLGGQVYSYHSCRNRHCPRRQQDPAQTWLAQQQDLLLPVPYFMVTFTLPAELREVARMHQNAIYALLFRASPPTSFASHSATTALSAWRMTRSRSGTRPAILARYCRLPAERVHPPVSPARPTQGLRQGALLRLFRSGNRPLLARIRGHLLRQPRIADLQTPVSDARTTDTSRVLVCPTCGQPLRLERVLAPCGAATRPHARFSVPCRCSHDHARVRLRRCPSQRQC